MAKKKQQPRKWAEMDPAEKRQRVFTVGLITGIVIIAVVLGYLASPPENLDVKRYVIQTSRGNIEIETYPSLMPITTANFDKLVSKGFYKNMKFHRVEDWVIQTGDPTGTGTGGSGETIVLETNEKLKNKRGFIGMARSTDPNSASSQFYILKKDAPSLNGQYAVFGRVTKGMEIVDKIKQGDRMKLIKKNNV